VSAVYSFPDLNNRHMKAQNDSLGALWHQQKNGRNLSDFFKALKVPKHEIFDGGFLA
jgi:hypothetical protein